MSQAVAQIHGRAFMRFVTCPPETDALPRRAVSGHALLQAIVLLGVVACGLLLLAVAPRTSEVRTFGDRTVRIQVQAPVIGLETLRVRNQAVAPFLAEVDEAAADPCRVQPLPHALPCLTAAGFRPLAEIVLPARDSCPPDRPPRHA